jgi:methionine-rich copper-binding protein CopC
MNNDVMSHEQAVSKQTAERYVLAELSQEEREAFEGHYFDCPACFEQVQLGMDFLHHTRDVLDPEPEKTWLARALGDLWRPVPAFVSAALVLAAGIGVYQHVQIADLKAPRLESRYLLVGQAKGGGPAKVLNVSRKVGLTLQVEFLRKPEVVSYQAQLVTASGAVKATIPVPATVTDDSLTISLPADALDAGTYSVVVYGVSADGARTEAGGGAFELRFTE